MFKQYVKDHEMTMMIECKNVFKAMTSSKFQGTTPFLTKIYHQNKDMDLLDYMIHFNKTMSQLVDDKDLIISIIKEIDKTIEGDVSSLSTLSSLQDLSSFALSLNLIPEKKALIKNIMNQYGL